MVINRSPSPYLKRDDRMQRMIAGPEKIHRIRCRAQYHAKVLNVYSPSEIWIQLFNDITFRLRIDYYAGLEPANCMELNSYVMAPVDKTILGRARIIQYLSTEKVVVFMIDDGKYSVADVRYIKEMPVDYRTYPWQAIGVALHDVDPADGDLWSSEEVDTIKSVLSEFEAVWVVPQLTTKAVNNDNEFPRVILNGLQENDLKEIYEKQQTREFDYLGFSINQMFAMQCPGQLKVLHKHDAMDQELYDVEGGELFTEDPPVEFSELSIDVTKLFYGTSAADWEDVLNSRDLPCFVPFSPEELELQGYITVGPTGEYRVNVIPQGDNEKATPKRFFARVICTTEESDSKSFDKTEKALSTLSQTLDEFYGVRANSLPLSCSHVIQTLKGGKRVFGVYEKQGDDAKGYLWRRVEIMKVLESRQNDSSEDPIKMYKIRFIDHGSQDTVLADSVHMIHPKHLKEPPFSLSLTMPCIVPHCNASWDDAAAGCFRRVIQAEGIVTCDVVNLKNSFDITNVVPVKNLKPRNRRDRPTVDQELIDKSFAVERSESQPIESYSDSSDDECNTLASSISHES